MPIGFQRHVALILGVGLCSTPMSLRAQKTGSLAPAPDTSTPGFVGIRAAEATTKDVFGKAVSPEGQQAFAVLVLDPSLTSTMRASAWSVGFVAFESGKEAKLQANLCDLPRKGCGKKSAVDLTLAAPIDESTHFTETADLQGLVGAARVELGGTLNLTNLESTKKSTTFSVRGAVGKPSFDFSDPTDLSAQTVRRTVYSIAASIGALKTTSQVAGLGYRHETTYKGRPEQTVCVSAGFGPSGTQKCDDMAVGEPRKKESNVAELEYRRSFRTAAIRLTIARDFKNDVTGFDLPIWVVPNQSGGLGGGFRFGYRTDTKRITAALFVSEFKL